MTLQLNNGSAFTELPSAVLLDMDNTLYPYEPAHLAGMGAVQAKAMQLFNVDRERFNDIFKIARQHVKEQLPGMASSHSRLLYFQRFLELMGLGSQVLIALDLEQTYWRTFLNHAVLFEGVREFLEELRLARIPLVLVTDLTAQIQFKKMVYLNLDHYFDYIVSSEEVGFDKPHPAPFKLAIEKIKAKGCVWMIGDDPVKDIQGAKEALGAVTLLLNRDKAQTQAYYQADAEFSDYADLIKIVKRNLTATVTL